MLTASTQSSSTTKPTNAIACGSSSATGKPAQPSQRQDAAAQRGERDADDEHDGCEGRADEHEEPGAFEQPSGVGRARGRRPSWNQLDRSSWRYAPLALLPWLGVFVLPEGLKSSNYMFFAVLLTPLLNPGHSSSRHPRLACRTAHSQSH